MEISCLKCFENITEESEFSTTQSGRTFHTRCISNKLTDSLQSGTFLYNPVAPLAWVPWVPGNPSNFEQWVPEPSISERKN